MKKLRLLLIWAVMLIAPLDGHGEALDHWYWRNPLPQGNTLYNVVFANGNYVAMGELGTILISTDGTNWVARESGTSVSLRDCAYGAGKYVVVGDFGTVLTSTDTITWTAQFAGTFYSLNGVTFASNQFIAVGEQTTILTSGDGFEWTPQVFGPWVLSDVIYADGLYLTAGGIMAKLNTPGVRVLLTSSNGRDWTVRVLEYGQPFHSLASGNGKFAVTTSADPWYGLSVLWTSTNGIDWQPHLTPEGPSAPVVIYGDGKWVLTFGDVNYLLWPRQILVSDDLVNWDSVFTNSVSLLGVCYGGGRFVAARIDGAFLLSTNTMDWENPWPDPGLPPLQELKFLNGRFWGLAYDHFTFSNDGIQWTNVAGPTNTGPIFGIAYGAGRYVAGGEYRTVWTSTNGVDWTNPDTNLSIYPYSAAVHVEYGNGVFVGASGYHGEILISADGLNWTVQQLATNESVYFSDIAFSNGRFVAVAPNIVATSTDGTNWFTIRTNLNLNQVVGGADKFVAIGQNTIATSVDGTNWQSQVSSDFGYLSDVAYGSGWFVATTAVSSSNPDLIKKLTPVWVSQDGIHWSKRFLDTGQGIGPIAFGNGAFVTGTQNGGILQSDPFVTLGLTFSPQPQVQVFGPRNRQYRIESCDFLIATNVWEIRGTVTSGDEPAIFTDSNETSSASRFYRALLLP